ncbi:MAG: hypothetical protein CSA04_04475 [Bacteroidetes bacterium]|nr:MAG: hypothetical protein CSA04_04475 [Bacteroidota bacterium]
MKNQQISLWFLLVSLLVMTLFIACTEGEKPEVENPPVAGFSATPLHGDAPLEVHFTNESQYDPESWSWNFGDGATSLEANPVHTYTDAGEYTVTLTVVKGEDSDSETKTHYITVTEGEEPEIDPPVAGFSATPLHGDAPLEVHFTNESQYDPESWSWNFGDGATSLEANPVHTYTDAGEYTVTLTVVKGEDSDSETKTHYITVTEGGGGIDGAPCPGMPTVTDVDGNDYNTVFIGGQCWMRENLKVTHYPNGDAIPHITGSEAWYALADNNTDDAYCYYNNNLNGEYGALYTYAAAIGDNWERDNTEGQGICPEGWHLPTDGEWTTLIGYLGGEGVAGGKMKEVGTAHWDTPNTGATNESGFTAFSGGYRYLYGSFNNVGHYGYWWSAMEDGSNNAWYRSLYYYSADVYRLTGYKSYGFSVRCVYNEQ